VREASKARERLQKEGKFETWIHGDVLDIGAGPDPITPTARVWDLDDGDAQRLGTVPDASYDTVFSSHCLEHMRNVDEALGTWWRVLRPGGHLVLLVPDEDLYEQGICPSIFNPDHKWSFSIHKDRSWSPVHVNLLEALERLPNHELLSVRVIDTAYDYSRRVVDGDPVDQTVGDAEAAIEAVVRKVDRELPLRNSLEYLLVCPSCRKQRLTLLGTDSQSTIYVRCGACGVTARIPKEQFIR